MPAVVRVKRRIDEEPLSAFVLNGKRRRLEEDNASALTNKDELSTLLKFAGTINEQDDSATTQYARLTKEEAKELVLQKTQKPSNATDKARQEMRQHQHEQRFRVVNCLRTTMDVPEDSLDEAKSKVTIVDIEKHSMNDIKTVETNTTTTNSATNLLEASTSSAAAAAAAAAALTMPTDSDTGYVYDLYIPDNEQQADYVDLMDDNYLSIRAFDNLIYEDRYNNDEDECDSEDSNEENHFGNDYPDEDDDAAMNSDREDLDEVDEYEDECAKDLRRGLKKFVFNDDDEENGEDDSSSDDDGYVNAYRDPYVHAIDPDEEGFCNDVDSCDVDRYGMAYARYKARLLKKSKPKAADDEDIDDSEEEEFHKAGTDEDDDDYYHSANESEEYF